MKKIILLIAVIGINVYSLKAQSPCTVTDLNSQATVNSFTTAYPGCTQITNSLRITGGDIINLAPLAAVTSVGGLDIDGTGLTSLTGLAALTTVSGNLRIANNGALTSIAALNKVTSVGGFLSVGVNAVLPNLTGLEKITTVGGAVSIGSNGALANLSGLAALTSINGSLNITGNGALTSLSGLSKLTSISNTNTKYAVNVTSNGPLTSLAGLDNINYLAIGSLTIQNSGSLSVCGVKSICKYLSSTAPTISISSNAAGCMTTEEVVTSSACEAALPVTLVSFTGKKSNEGNLLEWRTTSEITNEGFAVERSTNARVFEEIGFVKGNDNSNSINYYSFTDNNPSAITYYRLKQVDTDQSFTYSKMITVNVNDKSEAVTIYPNPASGQLFIEGNNTNQRFRLQTSSGIVLQEASQVPSKPIDTSALKNGLYLVTVGEETYKVVVSN